MADGFCLSDFFLDSIYASFQFRSVIDMDMADEVTRSKAVLVIFVAFEFMVWNVCIMPFTELTQSFVLYFFLLSHEVCTFIQADNDMEKIINTFSCPADRGNHWNPEELTQFFYV